MTRLFANSGDPDQTPRSAASDLGLHCLSNTLLRVSRLQWVKDDTSSVSEKAASLPQHLSDLKICRRITSNAKLFIFIYFFFLKDKTNYLRMSYAGIFNVALSSTNFDMVRRSIVRIGNINLNTNLYILRTNLIIHVGYQVNSLACWVKFSAGDI